MDFLEDCRNFVDFSLSFFVYHIGKREGVYDDMANAYSSVKSLALKNGELMEINIEVNIRRGINRFQIIGQNDSLVREALYRVKTSILEAGFQFPNGRIIVNLHPLSLPKIGTAYDLPIAIAILQASRQLNIPDRNFYFQAELNLRAEIVPYAGVYHLFYAIFKKKFASDNRPCFFPKLDLPKIFSDSLVFDNVYFVSNLRELVEMLRKSFVLDKTRQGIFKISTSPSSISDQNAKNKYSHDEKIINDLASINKDSEDYTFHDIARDKIPLFYLRNQSQALQAMTIALAGFHNLLLIGSPGSGKTSLARFSNMLLPPYDLEEGFLRWIRLQENVSPF